MCWIKSCIFQWFRQSFLKSNLQQKQCVLMTSPLYISATSNTALFLQLILHFTILLCSCNPCLFCLIFLLFFWCMSGSVCLKIYKSDKLGTRNKRRNSWDIHEQRHFDACRLFCCKKEFRLQHFSSSNIASNPSLEILFLLSWHGDQIHGKDFIQGLSEEVCFYRSHQKKIEQMVIECLYLSLGIL